MVGQGAVPTIIGPEYSWSSHKRYQLTTRAANQRAGATLRRTGETSNIPPILTIRESGVAEYVVEFGKDGRPVEPDGRLDAPAFHRNHQAIRAVLQQFLAGKTGDVVEAGSGTGQHVVDFARHFPEITWWPSDLNEQHLKTSGGGRAHAGFPNTRPPLRIDLSDPSWCSGMHDGS